ncbi:hypothetical protein L6V77_25035 [Myxococcota bacterium]|nr:hypothetical protein [Myxococcota bacterium]
MSDRHLRIVPFYPAVLAAMIAGCAPSLETGCKSDDDCSPGICSAGTCAPRPDADVMGDASGHDTGGNVAPLADAQGPEGDAAPLPEADARTSPPDAVAAGGGFTKPDGSVMGGSGGEGGAPPPPDAGIGGSAPAPDAVVTVSCEGAGQVCNNGLVGVCLTFGITECQADGSLRCNAPMAFGSDEICDGLDNDCDGAVDDRVSIWCFGANVALEGRGVCRAGYRECVGGSAGDVCHDEVLPSDEVCNGLDDDCDGETDEGVDGAACLPEGLDEAATLAVRGETGVCRPGRRSCVGGVPGECAGAVLPAAFDDCNGLDDDCDGALDEDCACVDGDPCGEWRPAPCQQGVLDCTRPAGEQCVDLVLPEAEQCNNRDDDCNGVVDDLAAAACYSGDAATRDIGACRSGTRTCDDGQPGDCLGEVLPDREVCNGLDDDCDGEIDEDFIGLGRPCAVGTGQCLVESFGRCGEDGDSVVCPVSPAPPRAEFCDGVDNDCDGAIDEDSDRSCYSGPEPVLGQCRRGVSRCVEGALGACEGEILPQAAEVCDADAADENCNGQYNEGCGCVAGTERACGEVQVEIGVCRPGRSQCTAAGVFGPCVGAVNPTAETCNGLDDDCDGETDEGGLVEDCYPGDDPREIGVGRCRSGTADCKDGGFPECTGAVTPIPETCNAVDDDCNGRVDDDIDSVECRTNESGVCAAGRTICSANGETICRRQQAPSAEVCNGLDDNCDGTVDNLAPTFGPLEVDPDAVAGNAASPVGVSLAWSAPARRYAAATIHVQPNGLATVRVRLIDPQGALANPTDVTPRVLASTLRQVRIAALPVVDAIDRIAFVVAWLETPVSGEPSLHLQQIRDDGAIGPRNAVVATAAAGEIWQSFDMIANGEGLTVLGAIDPAAVLGGPRGLQLIRLTFEGAVQWRHPVRSDDTTRFARDVAVAATTDGGFEYYGLTWTHTALAQPASVAYFTWYRRNQAGAAAGVPTRLVGPAANAPRIAHAVHAWSNGFLAAFLESSGSQNIVVQRFGFDGAVVPFDDARGQNIPYTIAATGDRTKSGTVFATLPNQDVGVFWREINNANGTAASLRFRRASSNLGWLPGSGVVVTGVGQALAGPAVARDGQGVLYPTQEINVPAPPIPPPIVVKMFDGEVVCPAPGDR